MYKNTKLLVLTIFFGIILRLIKIYKNLYIDEAFSLFFSQQPLNMIWKIGLNDPHPPLYNYLLHFWQLISNDVAFLRLSSVIFGIITIYIVYLIGKKLFDDNVGLLAAFFIAINPLHIQMSQQLRMYIPMTLFLCLSFYFLLKKKWIMYSIFGALSMWMEYLSILPLAVIVIYGLIKERFSKRFLIANIIMIVLIIPAGFFLLKSISSYRMISHSSPYWVFFILPYVFSVYLLGYINPYFNNLFPVMNFVFIGLFLSLLFFVYLFYRFVKQKKKIVEFCFLMVSPVLIAYALNPIFPLQIEAKRFMFGLCLLSIILAKGLSTLRNYKFKLGILFLLLIASVSLYSFYNYDYTNWRGAARFIEKK